MASGMITSASSGALVRGIFSIDADDHVSGSQNPKWLMLKDSRGSGITVPVPVVRTRWSALRRFKHSILLKVSF
jgi:hypothetical protein